MLVHIYQLILQFFIHKFSLHLHTYLYHSTKIILHSLQNQQASQKRAYPSYANKFKKHTIHCSYKHDNSLVLPVHFPSFILNIRRNSTWVTDIVAVVTDTVAWLWLRRFRFINRFIYPSNHHRS